jgi:hypothetical protein
MESSILKVLSVSPNEALNMELFKKLGFKWDREIIPQVVPTHSVERACFRFHKMLPEFVWDASVLEGNPFTFVEVKTLLDGVTVGGRKISDQEQVLNLAESSKYLLSLVKNKEFQADKKVFTKINSLVARNESLEWGGFRGEGKETNYHPRVALGEHDPYKPLPTVKGAFLLNKTFSDGIAELEKINSPFERSIAFFLFGALQQFFFDGNKRTSRFIMNGILMSNGIDAISIPASRAQEFNQNMVEFYLDKDATKMMFFMIDCHPDAKQIYIDNKIYEQTTDRLSEEVAPPKP